MEIKDIIKHTIGRIREDYIKEYKNKKRDDFNSGVLLGINIVFSALKNDLICLENNCLDNEEYIEEFGLDFDIDNEV